MKELIIDSNNALQNMMDYQEDVSQVTSIRIEHFELKSIPDEINKFYNTSNLSIGFTGLEELTNGIFELENLQELSIFDRIKIIPPKIGKLKSLKKLRISGDFNKIPKEIGKLKELKIFNLYGECFHQLPSSLGDLINLKELHLNGENLELLPETIGNLINLEKFLIGSNKIEYLPNTFKNLKKLKVINFSADPMYGVEGKIKLIPEYFMDFNQITSFSGSNFTNKEYDSFISSWDKLENLNLHDCGIDKIPFSIKNQKFLKSLSLTKGKINKIPSWINKLKYISFLDLSGNLLSEIPTDLLLELKMLTGLVLYQNPFDNEIKKKYELTFDKKIHNQIFD